MHYPCFLQPVPDKDTLRVAIILEWMDEVPIVFSMYKQNLKNEQFKLQSKCLSTQSPTKDNALIIEVGRLPRLKDVVT